MAVLGLGWGLFEAGWVRLRELELPLSGLPAELDGLRIVHLSDFHLGVPSPGARAVRRAVDWTASRGPDLAVITGDLLSRPAGKERLFGLLGRLDHPYAVLGNHDLADSRDPFSKRVDLDSLPQGTLLGDVSVELELRSLRVELRGVDPRSWATKKTKPLDFGESDADLRILLCHFPRVLEIVPPGRFHLVCSGHYHAGQIVIPWGTRKLTLAHLNARYVSGIYRRGETAMHLSPGLGTTFVPFRFFARPEATELVLRSA